MPIFEFRCEGCEQQFEQLVRNGEAIACPHCGAQKLEKLLSVPVGHVGRSSQLPIASSCPPSDAPPCSPHCCRLPS